MINLGIRRKIEILNKELKAHGVAFHYMETEGGVIEGMWAVGHPVLTYHNVADDKFVIYKTDKEIDAFLLGFTIYFMSNNERASYIFGSGMGREEYLKCQD